jgi:hypothetical protein
MRHLLCLLVLLWLSPAQADPYYRGELKHRPRLTFDGRDAAHTQRVVDRINAQAEPWASGYRALRRLVDQGAEVDHRNSGWKGQSDKWNVLYAQETRNGHLAAARALVVWLWAQGLDPAWLQLPRLPGQATPDGWAEGQAAKARRTIERMYDDWPCWRGFGVINRGIVAADSLAMHCVAYDLLAALPRASRGGLGTAERRLGDLASDLRYWFKLTDVYNNNHGMRVAGGLGIAAIALNRHGRYRWWKPGTWWHRPKGWFKKAERLLHPTHRRSDLRYQGRTGAFAEGTSYYAYAADLYLPFFFAQERFTRGSGTRFLAADLTNDLARWSVELRRPDGHRAQLDNARLFKDPTLGFFLSRSPAGGRAADRELLLWDYARNGYPGIGGRRAPFLLAAFDPTDQELTAALARPDPPGLAPTRFLERRGGAVLATGWDPDDAHVYVQAQHGELRTRGLGHESVANGAYAFYAYGDSVTIDPGYFGWTRVKETNRARHRSMVLVDGEGPRPAHRSLVLTWKSGGEDTRIVAGARTQAGPEVRSVETRTRYRKADLARTVALVGRRYLVVEDRCRAKRSKTFSALVQTNAGAARGQPLQRAATVVRYLTHGQANQVCVGAAASTSLSARTESRSSNNGEGPSGHDAIVYTAARQREVDFLTAVAVAPPAGPAPAVEALAASGGQALRVESGGSVDVVVSNPRGGTVRVPASAGTLPLTTSHALTIVSFDAAGQGRVLWVVGPGQVTVQ